MKIGIVVMRIDATCALVSDSPARNIVWFNTTPRIAKPAIFHESARVNPRPGTTTFSTIAAPATRSHANESGANECIATLEMM